jgi:hypothetical protein
MEEEEEEELKVLSISFTKNKYVTRTYRHQ